ncbi:MAG TPA: PDZ domain-containing protein [Pirellulales bacterium]|nr:PDZ domain-containing protein [Pirellulales bacterium]
MKKGYLAPTHHLDEIHKQKTGQQCTVCHVAATAPHGECMRGEGCLRDMGSQTKVTYLGVSVGSVPPAVRQHVKLPGGVGLMIENIEPGSPAAEAHLRAYDILERLDQQMLVNQEQFSALIKTCRPGEDVSVQLIRASEPKSVRVKLGDRVVDDAQAAELAQQQVALVRAGEAERVLLDDLDNAVAAQGRQPKKVTYLGINTSSPPPALVEQLKLAQGLYLVIDSIEPASPAAVAGLRPFDVLQKLDDQVLVNAEQLTVLIRNHRLGDEVELTLLREGQPLKVRGSLGEHQVAEAELRHEAVFADLDRDIHDLNTATVELLNDKVSKAVELSIGHDDVKDEDFVGRVYLDLVGTTPSSHEVTVFKADDRPNKRQRFVDALLSRPEVIGKIGGSAVLHWSDDEHSLVLSTSEAGQKRLLARDKQGSVVFDGSVDSDDERRQLDPRLASKLGLMLNGLAATAPADAAAAMERTLSRFEAQEKTLDQLLDVLRRQTGANIVVDRKALSGAGVDFDERLSLDLHDVRAVTVLKTLLALVRGPGVRLKHEVDDGVVLITAER